MGRDTLKGLDLSWRVVAPCNVIYPNQPERTRSGEMTIAYFSFEQHARQYVDYSVSGYFYRVEKNT